jgi:hypothetical protein
LEGDVATAIQAIQAILAPAVMITGVALLLLTLNARHSVVVNRIRLLDDEKRFLAKKLRKEGKLDDTENERLESIENQLDLLLPRLAYVRNGMLCHMLSVLFFVLTSFSIALGYFSFSTGLTQTMINVTFIAGMLLVLCGVAFLSVEIYVSYRVILIEVKRLK